MLKNIRKLDLVNDFDTNKASQRMNTQKKINNRQVTKLRGCYMEIGGFQKFCLLIQLQLGF